MSSRSAGQWPPGWAATTDGSGQARKRGPTDGDVDISAPGKQPQEAAGSGAVGSRLTTRTSAWIRAALAAATAVAFVMPVALVPAPASAANADITTVAGTGTTTPAVADGGQATSGAIDAPDGLVFDAAQNLIVVNYNSGGVRQIAPNGTVSPRVAAGTMVNPTDVVVTPSGTLYVASYGGHRVYKVVGSTVTILAGTGVAGYGGDNGPASAAKLDKPAGLALDGAGNLYVADSGNNRVRRISTSGTITTIAGTG